MFGKDARVEARVRMAVDVDDDPREVAVNER